MTAHHPTGSARPGLVRAIGRWDLTAAVINGVIGSAIFGMPSDQARLTGAWSPLVMLVAGLGVVTIVLCFAEVASRFQEAGGPYLYAREAFGPFVGFEAGWLMFWVRITAVAANLNVFADYLARLAPAAGEGWSRAAVMTALLAVVTGINLVGVRQATWTIDAFTIAKLLPLALLAGLGLWRVHAAVLASQAVAEPQWANAIVLLVFAYGGFETPLIPAGEARNPRRDTAFALLTAMAVIATVYCVVQFVVVGLVPGVAGVKAPIAQAFGALLGGPGVVLASVAAMVSIYGYSTGSTLQSPRLLFAMAERGELPAPLARVHERFRTPHVAILAHSVLALGLALYGSFTWNATLSAIVRLLTWALTCVALLVFRRRAEMGKPGFRLPGAAVVVPFATACCLWLLATRTLTQAWITAALVAMGALLFLLRRRV
ncbi:MAG TPA: APC family permease [Vicinamibacteria bacterium]|nr:APC family permease [Vicinamibacteria bacterium]